MHLEIFIKSSFYLEKIEMEGTRLYSWRNKCNLEQRCLILDVIPEPG